MKYGVLMHKITMNLGDDIQSYALSRFYPHIDYIVDRENLDSFTSKDNEPVAVIMSAWWMWQKWNWPPAECIVPKLTSMHINEYGIRRKASPIKNEWFEGIGGEYFRQWGPVGCRDMTTVDILKNQNIDCYFSGCVTLTLPKQKETYDKGTYVCLVDLNPELENAAREWLKDSGLEIRKLTHHCDYRKSDATMEERFHVVEDTLTQYQNAKFVVTRRLHVTLPCLAMGTPVISIVDMKDKGNTTRWAPYHDWVHAISEKDFKEGNFAYDYQNPPANKDDYLSTRNALIKELNDFVAQTKDCEEPIERIKKTTFTEEEARAWQNKLMHWTLDRWLHLNRGIYDERNNFQKEANALKKQVKTLEDQLKHANKKILEQKAEIQRKGEEKNTMTLREWWKHHQAQNKKQKNAKKKA